MTWTIRPLPLQGRSITINAEPNHDFALRDELATTKEMVRILLKIVEDLGGPTATFVNEVHRLRLPRTRTVQEDRDFVMFNFDGSASEKFTFGPGARWFRYARHTPGLHDPPEKMSPAMARVAALLHV